jgi:hypothetical protein
LHSQSAIAGSGAGSAIAKVEVICEVSE